MEDEREHEKEFDFVVEKLIKVSQHELQLITRCCLFYSFDGEKYRAAYSWNSFFEIPHIKSLIFGHIK